MKLIPLTALMVREFKPLAKPDIAEYQLLLSSIPSTVSERIEFL